MSPHLNIQSARDYNHGRRDQSDGLGLAAFGQVSELNAVIGDYDFDLVENGLDELLMKPRCRRRIGPFKPGQGDLRYPIDRDKQIELGLMVFKLIIAASKTWRRLKRANQLKVIAGVSFRDGSEVIQVPANHAA